MQITLKKTGKLLKFAFKEWWAKDPFKNIPPGKRAMKQAARKL
jgi:hypothetical protein